MVVDVKYSSKEINEHFGKIIKLYRENKEISQEYLAEQLNISAKFLSRIENGRTGTSYETLLKLIDFLDIPPNILYKDIVSNNVVLDNIYISEEYDKMTDEQKNFIKIIIDEMKKI